MSKLNVLSALNAIRYKECVDIDVHSYPVQQLPPEKKEEKQTKRRSIPPEPPSSNVGRALMFAGGALVCAAGLPILAGFGTGGVVAGSLAASIQGPAVAAGSWFAMAQSLGATGTLAAAATCGAQVAMAGAVVDGMSVSPDA